MVCSSSPVAWPHRAGSNYRVPWDIQTLSKGCDPVRAKVPFIRAIRTSVRFILERIVRIELTSPAWKAGVIAIIRHPQFGYSPGKVSPF